LFVHRQEAAEVTRLLACVAAVALFALIGVAPASAHQGNPNFRSQITRVTPATPGVRLDVLGYDDRLELTNRSHRTVTVMGYNGEPYARVAPDGTVEVNQHSPALYLNEDRYAAVAVPPQASGDAAPQWKVLDRTGRFQWHDHRIHYMAKGTPPAVKDTKQRTKVFDWRVPVRVGTRSGAIAGTLWWQPPSSGSHTGAFLALGALALLALIGVAVVRRRRARADGAAVAGEAW
jgi:LPXTG-motif cell wall-anchored protein